MKKKSLFVFVAIVAMFAGYSDYKVRTNAKMSDLLLTNMEALAEPEQDKGYKKSTGNCTITASAGATVDLKVAGIKIASAKAGTDGSVTFEDVKVDCEINGTYLCKPRDCADFYIDLLK